MISLKKQNSAILFLLAFSMTVSIITLTWMIRLNNKIDNFKPVVIERVEPTEATEPIETVPEATTEVVPESTECPIKIDCPLDDATQHMIHQICVEYDVDYPLVMSVIFHESSFRPNANSGSSVGLMQINKVNHKRLSKKLGITDFFDPKQNVTAGVYMLRELFDKYEDPAKVLMAYNMGEGGAAKLWKQGVYTSGYAKAVLSKADKYAKEIEERMGENV